MDSRARDQSREAGDEVERRKDDGSRAVTPVAVQAVDHGAVLGERESLARDRWPCEVAALALAPVP